LYYISQKNKRFLSYCIDTQSLSQQLFIVSTIFPHYTCSKTTTSLDFVNFALDHAIPNFKSTHPRLMRDSAGRHLVYCSRCDWDALFGGHRCGL